MTLCLSQNKPIIQDANDYALGVTKLRVWAAEMQALNLGTHSQNRTIFGYTLHMHTIMSDAFGVSQYKGTTVIVIPDELKSWFGLIQWRSVVCCADRLFLITEIEGERFSISLSISSTALRIASLKEANIIYMQVGPLFEISSFIGVNFNYDNSLLTKEEYYCAI